MYKKQLSNFITAGSRAYWLMAIIAFSLHSFGACSADDAAQSDVQSEDISSPPSVSGSENRATEFVELTEQQATEMDINLYSLALENLAYSIELPGRVRPAPDGVATVGTPIEGRISEIYVQQGEAVEAGQALIRLESRALAELTAGFMEAVAERRYLGQQSDRLENLVAQNVSPERELQRVRADLARAEAQLQAGRTRLRAVGIPANVIDRWAAEGMTSAEEVQNQAFLTLHAPIAGRINEYSTQKGAFVDPGISLLSIINPDMALVQGFASPGDLPDLRPGAGVKVHAQQPAGGDRNMEIAAGQISGIQPAMDTRENAVIINSIIQPRPADLIIGQSVRISYAARTSGAVLSVPSSSVFYEESEAFVFVRVEPLRYEKRRIIIQQQLPEEYIVARGVEPGEELAASQIFSLKALAKFEDFAED